MSPRLADCRQAPIRDLARAPSVKTDDARVMLFGDFRFVMHRRELLENGVPVPIGNRAIDVLVVLIEARGELVTKDELMSRVWPNTIVEENSLQFQISTLRRALGKNRDSIKTVSGRGYRFIADVEVEGRAAAAGEANLKFDQGALSAGELLSPPGNLPALTSDLVGREDSLADLEGLIAANRLVTLVGPGGIGKSRLGVEIARRLRTVFADGVWLVELGSISDPRQVPMAVATALGLGSESGSVGGLAATTASRRLLLIIDNCEHLIEAAAIAAEAILRSSPSLHIVATSREPLRVEGEWVYRVPQLEAPPEGTETFEQLMEYSAAKLFVARAQAAEPHLKFGTRTVSATAKMCRRLDGLPLAIELAAAGAATFGVEEIASRLDDQLGLLTDGRRTAPPRHRSLRATFEWSYQLLGTQERALMQCLSTFDSAFTMEEAANVANGELAASDFAHSLATLVRKSLVVADLGGPATRYRLLETTRAYALEKLLESSESEASSWRQSALARDGLGIAKSERKSPSKRDLLVA